jgi:Flp pilus assembly protein TadB
MERSTALKAQMVSHFGPQIWQTWKTHVPEHHRNPMSGPCGPGLQPLTELTPRCTRQSLETAGVDQYLHLYSLISYICTYIYTYIHTLYIYIIYIYICIYIYLFIYLFVHTNLHKKRAIFIAFPRSPKTIHPQPRPKQESAGQS